MTIILGPTLWPQEKLTLFSVYLCVSLPFLLLCDNIYAIGSDVARDQDNTICMFDCMFVCLLCLFVCGCATIIMISAPIKLEKVYKQKQNNWADTYFFVAVRQYLCHWVRCSWGPRQYCLFVSLFVCLFVCSCAML